MTHPNTHFNAFEEAIQLLTHQGPEALAEAFRILLNHAMQAERSQALAAQPYQRTPERKGHANGFNKARPLLLAEDAFVSGESRSSRSRCSCAQGGL